MSRETSVDNDALLRRQGMQVTAQRLPDDSGYEIDEAQVTYWGRCPECVASTSASPGG